MVDVVEINEKWENFFDANKESYLGKSMLDIKSIIIDFSELLQFDVELAEKILDEPEEIMKCAEYTLQGMGEELFVRFKNLPKINKFEIRNIRAHDLKKLLWFEGTIRQSTDVRPQIITAHFRCPDCETSISVSQVEDKIKKPTKCSCGRSGKFPMISKDLIDIQKIVLEESAEDLKGGDAQPKRINVILKNDLVEPKEMKKTVPGTKIRVVGTVKEIERKSQFGGVSTVYDLLVEANYIEPIQEDFDDIIIEPEDVVNMKALAKRDDVHEVLTNSIAPSILGLDKIKLALLLQLFGGVKKNLSDGTMFREMIHVLLIGDPGTSKSKLSTYIYKTAPKSRYLAGKGATAVGLTATVLKDDFTKGYVLEAGALVLTNNGILVLDELDKMSDDDTSALHEALEQGTISIAKANVQAKLNSRTSLLAAANPKFGRFDPYKTVAEQIDMPPALINRFDLIFALRDVPNEDSDNKIAKHILSFGDNIGEGVITQELFRKYIAFARQKIFPKLSKEAEAEIRKFYVKLRNHNSHIEGQKPIPISPRQLEALVRLAEASARIRLSEEVNIDDANRAIKLLRHSLEQVGIDPHTGEIDMDVIAVGIPTSLRQKIDCVLRAIDEISGLNGENVPIQDVVLKVKMKGVDELEVDTILDKLSKEGRVFNPKPGFVKKV